jgi:transcriptional regulator with XRE-family HTH domain
MNGASVVGRPQGRAGGGAASATTRASSRRGPARLAAATADPDLTVEVDPEALGRRLRLILEAVPRPDGRSWRLTEVAEQISSRGVAMPLSYLSRARSGAGPQRTAHRRLAAIAEFFDLPVTYLVSGTPKTVETRLQRSAASRERIDAGVLGGRMADLLAGGSGGSLRQIAEEITAKTGVAVSASYLAQLRNGTRDNPSARKVAAVASFFGVPVSYLTGGSEDSGPGELSLQLIKAMQNEGVQEIALRSAALDDPNLIRQVITFIEGLPTSARSATRSSRPPTARRSRAASRPRE